MSAATPKPDEPQPSNDIESELSEFFEEMLDRLEELTVPESSGDGFQDLEFGGDDIVHVGMTPEGEARSLVFRAWSPVGGRHEILKFVLPGSTLHAWEALVLTEREYALAAPLEGHRGIATLFGRAYTDDGVAALRIQDLGDTFHDLIATKGPLAGGAAARYGKFLCEALAFCHSEGVCHLDLKPQNIGRAENQDEPVLFDFGLGAHKDVIDVRSRGTRGFRAPEQLRGEGDVRSDVFGVGATLFWLVEGRAPFHDDDFSTPKFKVLEMAELMRVILRCLEPAPEDRYATMVELENALEPLVVGPKKPFPDAPLLVGEDRAEINSGASLPKDSNVYLRLPDPEKRMEIRFVNLNNDEHLRVLTPAESRIGDADQTASWKNERAHLISPGLCLDQPEGVAREVLVAIVSPEPLPEVDALLEKYRALNEETKGARTSTISRPDQTAEDREELEELLIGLRRRGYALSWNIWELHYS